MPRLSDSMEEGTVLKWLVEEGGEVKRGEPLVEIETDKANMTYEADTDGVLIEVVAEEGDTLPIGEVIARDRRGRRGEGGGEAEADGARAPRSRRRRAEEPRTARSRSAEQQADEPERADRDRDRERPSASNGAGDGERIKASPVARRMAGELGVELARLEGSGPGGRIVKADVEAAAEDGGAEAEAEPRSAPAEAGARPSPRRGEAGAKGEVEVHELTRLQQTVTRRMAESKATAPDFALTLDVDMTGAWSCASA